MFCFAVLGDDVAAERCRTEWAWERLKVDVAGSMPVDLRSSAESSSDGEGIESDTEDEKDEVSGTNGTAEKQEPVETEAPSKPEGLKAKMPPLQEAKRYGLRSLPMYDI